MLAKFITDGWDAVCTLASFVQHIVKSDSVSEGKISFFIIFVLGSPYALLYGGAFEDVTGLRKNISYKRQVLI
jgi:hypothetical protein